MASLTDLNIFPFDQKRQGVYIGLDELFDTRLACLEEVNVEIALNAITRGWSERVYDTVPGVDDELYAKLYAQRSVSTLSIAHPTPIVDFLKNWVDDVHHQIKSHPFGGFCEVFINVWPYKLPKSKARQIATTVAEHLHEDTRVTLLNIDPLEITCLDAKRYFSAIFMNDYHKWLDTRCSSEIRLCPIPDVSLYVPKALKGNIDDRTRNKLAEADIYLQAEQALATMIRLQFLETELFSSPITADMFVKDKPEEKAE